MKGTRRFAATGGVAVAVAVAVLPEPPEDVFHIHHGVVDQLANGNGQPPESHGVDRDSREVKNHCRGQD